MLCKTITVWAAFPRKRDWNSGFDERPIHFLLCNLKSKYTFIFWVVTFFKLCKQLSLFYNSIEITANSHSLEIKSQTQNVLIGVHQIFKILDLWWSGDLLSAQSFNILIEFGRQRHLLFLTYIKHLHMPHLYTPYYQFLIHTQIMHQIVYSTVKDYPEITVKKWTGVYTVAFTHVTRFSTHFKGCQF